MEDPLSRVASWLSDSKPATEDPVATLLAESKQLFDRADSAYFAACEIEAALPDDVRSGRVPVEMLGGGILGFKSEESLKKLIGSRMGLAETRARLYPADGDERDYVREWSEKGDKGLPDWKGEDRSGA